MQCNKCGTNEAVLALNGDLCKGKELANVAVPLCAVCAGAVDPDVRSKALHTIRRGQVVKLPDKEDNGAS